MSSQLTEVQQNIETYLEDILDLLGSILATIDIKPGKYSTLK